MRNKKIVSEITLDGLFIAILVVMSILPIGFIPLGTISATILPIPVILGTAFLGWKRGLLYGTAFGVSSFLVAIIRGGAGDALFIDPLISILPRALFGGLIGVYALFLMSPRYSAKTKRMLIFPFSALAMLTHSVLVLSMIYLRYVDAFLEFLAPVMIPLVLAEVAIATVLTPLLYNALYKPFEKYQFKFSDVHHGDDVIETTTLSSDSVIKETSKDEAKNKDGFARIKGEKDNGI